MLAVVFLKLVTTAMGTYANNHDQIHTVEQNTYCKSFTEEASYDQLHQCAAKSTLSLDYLIGQCLCEPSHSLSRQINPGEIGVICDQVGFGQIIMAWIESENAHADTPADFKLMISLDDAAHPAASLGQMQLPSNSRNGYGDMIVLVPQKAGRYVVSLYNNTLKPIMIKARHFVNLSIVVYVIAMFYNWHLDEVIRRERLWRADMRRMRNPVVHALQP